MESFDPNDLEQEPDRRNVYMDETGDLWWYNERKGGWWWTYGKDAPYLNTDDCAFERVWGVNHMDDAPWTWVGTQEGGLLTFNSEKIQEAQEQGEATATGFVVKDSGAREEYANGFVRDTEEGKYDYARVLRIEGLHLIPVEALERWAAHMVKGAKKYGEDNWRQARGPVAVARFLRSLGRHVVQYIQGDRTEDHAAAVCFNVWAAELTPGEE